MVLAADRKASLPIKMAGPLGSGNDGGWLAAHHGLAIAA
jgi:hypothetical protein